MRLRVGISCATITCSGVAVALVSTGGGCFGSALHVQYEAGALDGTTYDVWSGPQPEAAAEAALPEAGPDAGPEAGPEAGLDAAPEAEAGCAPRSIQGFVAPPYVPAARNINICLLGFVNAEPTLAADCFSDASTFQACSADIDGSMPDGGLYGPCLGCLVTPENTDAGGYGATIVATIPVLNVAGCVEATDPTDAGVGCAAAIQAAWQCTDYACAPSCPVTDDPSRAAYIQCAQAAAATVCSAYSSGAAACLAAETDMGDTGVPTQVTMNCFNDAGFYTDPNANLLMYFCGS
jgi:hypothetical protein